MVVYAERAIPANRQVPVESNSAFSDLNFATYLGSQANAVLCHGPPRQRTSDPRCHST